MTDQTHHTPVTQAHPLRWESGNASLDAASGVTRAIATEVPIALQYNCISHAVMMATPQDLHDFALGFSLSEGIIDKRTDLLSTDIQHSEKGVVIDMEITPACFERLDNFKRSLLGMSGCGLCGRDRLEHVITPLPVINSDFTITGDVIHSVLTRLRDHQPLTRQTGAFHAAAFANAKGDILAAREDVGRHNALDKLIGHLAGTDIDPSQGFILMSSRCSFELVHKTARAGVPLLTTISAPTSLALELAKQSRLTLIALARSDSMLVFTDPAQRFRA
ncbi:MAG: sulfurtransferase FdhD [Kordiimonas sp.]|nr:sulfurtransferase FdhD [Kordiimonas sp.]